MDAFVRVPENHRQQATTASGEKVRPNESVELQDGTFLRIRYITKDYQGAHKLWGIRLIRNEDVKKTFSQTLGHYLKAFLPDKHNEVCAVIETKADTGTDAIDAFLVKEPLSRVVRKQHITITNNTNVWGSDPVGTLYCRWRFIERADKEKRILRVTRSESDVTAAMHPYWDFHQHRSSIDRSRTYSAPYTYNDICAGGGGTTQAAVLAGLDPRFLLDIDAGACETLRLNFGADVVLQQDVCEFSQLKESGLAVDVMHISYICCPHSVLNQHTNHERDAELIALGYTLPDILRLCKPRIVTMEQVPGIERSDDGQHLRSYIQALTESGYECCWRIINLQNHSAAQARKRVIIYAACPGQHLPSWPEKTNGTGRGLLPPVTIEDALLLVPDSDSLPVHMLKHTRKPNAKHTDPKQPLKGCITTNGGATDIHPFEKRSFNMAELAVLNGFPPWHRFPDELGITHMRRLIGNAVPALPFKHFFDKVVEALKQTDSDNLEYEQTEGRDFMDWDSD